jgi:hypothetical protein
VEAAALVSSRSIEGLTGEMSVVSPVVKALAPTLVDAMLGQLADLLGARSVLTDGCEGRSFSKVRRDHQVVSIFDGSTPVNRAALTHQFPRLVQGFAAGTVDIGGLHQATAVGEPANELHFPALALLSRRGCSLVQSLPQVVASVAGTPGLSQHAVTLLTFADRLHSVMADVRPAARPDMAGYELAAAYELCYAGAACLHLWHTGETQHRGEPLWTDGLWARAALRALLARLAGVLRMPRPAAAAGDDRIDGPLAHAITSAAESGAPLTPFGDPGFSTSRTAGGPGGR